MQVLPIDIVGLVAVIMGISVVLIPVMGLTARYALKPVVEVMDQYLRSKDTKESVQIVERRLALLEQHLDDMQGSLGRLVEVSEFDAQLRAGRSEALRGRQEAASDAPEAGDALEADGK